MGREFAAMAFAHAILAILEKIALLSAARETARDTANADWAAAIAHLDTRVSSANRRWIALEAQMVKFALGTVSANSASASATLASPTRTALKCLAAPKIAPMSASVFMDSATALLDWVAQIAV